MADRQSSLVVIDDDAEIAALVRHLAERAGFAVHVIAESAKLHEHAAIESADTIVLDLQMPGLAGVQVLRVLAEMSVQAHIIIVSGMDDRTRLAAES
jgi:DNA-binding response OmpR family regulator